MKRTIASLVLFLMILAIMPTHSVAQNIFLTGNIYLPPETGQSIKVDSLSSLSEIHNEKEKRKE
jgi:hypothetical protein